MNHPSKRRSRLATASYRSSLPRVFYTNGQFSFEPDVRSVSGQPVTYSAGIVSRAKLPTGISGNNAERLDTLTNSMNMIAGNEIRDNGSGVFIMWGAPVLRGNEISGGPPLGVPMKR